MTNPRIVKISENIYREIWCNEKHEYHRDDGAAIREFVDNKLYYECYYKNGCEVREDGPSYIKYDTDGSVKYCDYCFEDEDGENYFDSLEEMQNFIKTRILK